jgi:hypothetical protein
MHLGASTQIAFFENHGDLMVREKEAMLNDDALLQASAWAITHPLFCSAPSLITG